MISTLLRAAGLALLLLLLLLLLRARTLTSRPDFVYIFF